MPASDDSRTLGRARLSFSEDGEVDRFVEMLNRFERGEISPNDWRAFRLVHGTYGQRQDDQQMLRVKIPQGILTAAQLDAIAHVSAEYSRGFAHVTTRQNFQLHFLKLGDIEAVMGHLASAGLTTREACGNSVRTITACPFSGVARDERFDVTPYAEALTRFLLRHPLSSTLPRKFKIAFEGCADDHALTAINDLGFRGVVVDGRRGFRVLAGGGTGTLPTAARELFPFLPASQISSLAEAVLTVFHRLGDREHKERNRMKFLIRALGFERWKGDVLRDFEDILAAGVVERDTEPDEPPSEGAPQWERPPAPSIADVRRAAEATVRGPGIVPQRPAGPASYEEFLGTNVREQKQDGFSLVFVTLPLGDVTAPQLRVLGQLALAYGDGTVRLTHEQDLLLRWVRSADVRGLFDRLEAAGLGLPGANTVSDVTSCPGAESCRLAVTHSRGVGRLLHEHLSRRPEIALLAEDLKVKASGCPNGCGQHHIAGIGLQGSVRQLGGKAVPQYFVMTGGEITQSDTFFAKTVARIPARRLPEAVEALIRLYQDEKTPDETAPAFFRRIGAPRQKALLANLERLTLEEALPEDFVDPGQEGESTFEVDVKAGECAT